MDLDQLYERLDRHYRLTEWWPAESAWEVMVGAVLVQQTAWENAARVLDDLKARGILTVAAVDRMPVEEFEGLIRSTGFYRRKARTIKALALHLRQRHHSDPCDMLCQGPDATRTELLSLPGIGKETADAILLFAGGYPRFIAAAYVARVLGRTGMFLDSDYDRLQGYIHANMVPNAARYAHFYALIVHHARTVCRSHPRCHRCPVRTSCPSADEEEEEVADQEGEHQGHGDRDQER